MLMFSIRLNVENKHFSHLNDYNYFVFNWYTYKLQKQIKSDLIATERKLVFIIIVRATVWNSILLFIRFFENLLFLLKRSPELISNKSGKPNKSVSN